MKLMQIAIAADQLANAVLGGWADETLSARCWRLRAYQPYKALRHVVDALFILKPDHCQRSYESERLRAQMPKEYRQ